MSAGNGRSSRCRISQAMASMSSLSLGFWSSDGGAGASNRIAYSRYGAAALEQATAASIATTIGQRPLMRASIPRGRRPRQVCFPRRRCDHGTRFGRLVAQGGITAGMLNALVAMDLPGPGTVFMNQSLRYLAPGTVVLEGECWTYTLRPE